MFYLLAIFVFLIGTVVGSFLNVVALRYNTGKSLAGRSGCFSCGKTLSPRELVPVFSFLFLRGRCSSCGAKISWQYPLVEFTTGILFLLTFLHLQEFLNLSPILFLFRYSYFVILFCLLLIITIYDFKHKIIPDGLVYAFIILSLISAVFNYLNSYLLSPISILDLLAGPILFLPFFLLWFVSQGKWIGLGDGKLALGIGFLLGISGGISAIILGFWIGAAVSLALLAAQKIVMSRQGLARSIKLPFLPKNLTIKSEIPFGPFLILGVLLVFFFGIQIIDFNLLFIL